MCLWKRVSGGRPSRVCWLVLLGGLIFSGAAQASIIITSQWPPDIFMFNCPGASCPALLAQLISGPVTSANGNVTFTMNAAVYSDPWNAYCTGCLDFV
jgi:hypothetical protein